MSEFVELCYDVVWSLQVPFRVIRDFFEVFVSESSWVSMRGYTMAGCLLA